MPTRPQPARQLSLSERMCLDLAGDSPEGQRLCADPDVQRCLQFFSGEEATIDNLLGCYGAPPDPTPFGSVRAGRS